MPTQSALEALKHLRDPATFQWYVVPLFAFVVYVYAVMVEMLLHAVGALTWDYSWWNAGSPWLIVIFGYLTFFIVSYWVFDMKTIRKKVATLGVIYGIDLLAILIFEFVLGWL